MSRCDGECNENKRRQSLLRRISHRRPRLLFYGVHSVHSDQRESMKCCIINKGNLWNWDIRGWGWRAGNDPSILVPEVVSRLGPGISGGSKQVS